MAIAHTVLLGSHYLGELNLTLSNQVRVIGIILLGILAGTAEGYSSSMFYAIVYAIMSLGGSTTSMSRYQFKLKTRRTIVCRGKRLFAPNEISVVSTV